MGYETSLHLVKVKIKKESIPLVNLILKSGNKPGFSKIGYFFEHIFIDSEGFLHLKAKEYCNDAYGLNEKDGTARALDGKWYDSEDLASLLKPYCEKGGRIVLHSAEGDGLAWGWEFNGRGGMKYFQLDHVGKWK